MSPKGPPVRADFVGVLFWTVLIFWWERKSKYGADTVCVQAEKVKCAPKCAAMEGRSLSDELEENCWISGSVRERQRCG